MKVKFTLQLKQTSYLLVGIVLFLVNSLFAQNAPTATQTFTYTGAVQQFTVPPCVGSMTILAMGASGSGGGSGGSAGSNGGLVRGVMTATPGQVMYFYVGGQGSITAGGFNGGGGGGVSSTSSGGGGGGASDVRIGGTALSNRILVAGAGGGGGGNSTYSPISGAGGAGSAFTSSTGFGGGGAGGCATGGNGGESGGTGTSYGSGGGGGGLTSGGGGGGLGSSTGGYGCTGTLGNGGAGGGTSFICGGATGGVNGGGGGGGGYYGGGGGMTGTGGCNGGGGGGSSWISIPMFTSTSFTSGATNTVSGHGFITIIYAFNGSLTNASVTPFAICQGQTATITANGSSTYTWNTSAQTNSITVSPTSNTTYTVTGTNSIGCISTAIITVTVTSGSPVLSVSASTNQICLGRTATLTASGALTYTWTNGVINGQSFAPTTSNTYTVLGQNGCGTSSAVASISVTPLPISAIASSSVVCAGNVLTLSAISAGTSYTWQPFSLLGASVAVSPNVSTIYTVSATDGTCSGVATVSVLANPNPTLTSSISNTSICEGSSVTLSANGALGYTWTPGNLTGSVITVTPNSPTQYSVVGNNSIGCLGGSSQIVIVYPSPTLNITASDPIICTGGASTISVSGADTYTWASGANTTTIVVNPNTTTSYSVGGTFTAGAGCSSSSVITISVFEPTVSISGSTATCSGSLITLNANGGGSWQWSNGASSQAISVSPVTTSIYSVTALTTSGSINCPSSSSIQVTVYPNPTVTASSSRSVMCKGESNTLTVNGASTYTWNTGSTSTIVTITPSLVTTLNYTIDARSINGCLGTTSLQVKVNACTALNENMSEGSDILIYPNPNNGSFYVKANSELRLTICNELGQLVKELSLNQTNQYEIEITDLPKGIYFIQTSTESSLTNKKIIVTY